MGRLTQLVGQVLFLPATSLRGHLKQRPLAPITSQLTLPVLFLSLLAVVAHRILLTNFALSLLVLLFI
jgi:hypothetical protein